MVRFVVIVITVQILSALADEIDLCGPDEIETVVMPYCHRPNDAVAVDYGFPFCSGEPCPKEPCPEGTRRGDINITCTKAFIPQCLLPNVEFRAKSYCVPRRCEKRATFEACVQDPATVILDSDDQPCPDGMDRGRRKTVCFIETDFESYFCSPGDRSHDRTVLQPYCVPVGFESMQLAPLKRMQPTCDGQPCLALNSVNDVCPAGWERGKRQFRCAVTPDVDECLQIFGKYKRHIPPYCYPDNASFEYGPYCAADSGCVAVDPVTGHCPAEFLRGPIASVCGQQDCPTNAIKRIPPYCEPVGQPSYLTRDGVALCGNRTLPDPCPQLISPTSDCPAGTQRGAMETICDPATAMDERPFTIRHVARPFCVSYPFFITISSFSPAQARCGLYHPCHFLKSTTEACPPGMFRGDTAYTYIPNPIATECPEGYSGVPPMCVAYSGYGAVAPNYINPSVIKSMIG